MDFIQLHIRKVLPKQVSDSDLNYLEQFFIQQTLDPNISIPIYPQFKYEAAQVLAWQVEYGYKQNHKKNPRIEYAICKAQKMLRVYPSIIQRVNYYIRTIKANGLNNDWCDWMNVFLSIK